MPATGRRTSSSLTVGSLWSKRSRPPRRLRSRYRRPRRPRPPSKSSSSSSLRPPSLRLSLRLSGRPPRSLRSPRSGPRLASRLLSRLLSRPPRSLRSPLSRLRSPPSRLRSTPSRLRSPPSRLRPPRSRLRCGRSPSVRSPSAGTVSVDEGAVDEVSVDEVSVDDEVSADDVSADGVSADRASVGPLSVDRVSVGRVSVGASATSCVGEPAGRRAPGRVRPEALRVPFAVPVTGPPFAPPLTGASRGAAEAATPGVLSAPFGRETPFARASPPAEAPPPTWRAEMAATRSPLRIRAVPEIPSSAARRCSSGSSIPDRPLPRRRGRFAVPEAAGASLEPAASGVPVTTRSVVSLTYRSFPAVTCAVRAQGCSGSRRVRPGGGSSCGKRVESARWFRGDGKSIVCDAPREARPIGRLLRELRRSSRTGQHRRFPACSSLSRRYLSGRVQYPGPLGIDRQRQRRPPRRSEQRHARDVVPRGQHQHARPGAGDDGGVAGLAEPVHEGHRVAHRGGPLAL